MSIEEVNQQRPAAGGTWPSREDKVAALLHKARQELAKGKEHYRLVAEHIEEAIAEGATQALVAEVLDVSEAWVSIVLKWHKEGCPGTTPFARSNRPKPAPQPLPVLQPPKDEPTSATTSATAERSSEDIGDSGNPGDTAAGSKSEWATPQRTSTFGAEASGTRLSFPPAATGLSIASRQALLDALRDLDAPAPEDRALAAEIVSDLRHKVGLDWDKLIVAAEEPLALVA